MHEETIDLDDIPAFETIDFDEIDVSSFTYNCESKFVFNAHLC